MAVLFDTITVKTDNDHNTEESDSAIDKAYVSLSVEGINNELEHIKHGLSTFAELMNYKNRISVEGICKSDIVNLISAYPELKENNALLGNVTLSIESFTEYKSNTNACNVSNALEHKLNEVIIQLTSRLDTLKNTLSNLKAIRPNIVNRIRIISNNGQPLTNIYANSAIKEILDNEHDWSDGYLKCLNRPLYDIYENDYGVYKDGSCEKIISDALFIHNNDPISTLYSFIGIEFIKYVNIHKDSIHDKELIYEFLKNVFTNNSETWYVDSLSKFSMCDFIRFQYGPEYLLIHESILTILDELITTTEFAINDVLNDIKHLHDATHNSDIRNINVAKLYNGYSALLDYANRIINFINLNMSLDKLNRIVTVILKN